MVEIIKDRNYYICRTKRQYKWVQAHIRKYVKWDDVHLYVYRCQWCGLYHLSKSNKGIVRTLFVRFVTTYPRTYA